MLAALLTVPVVACGDLTAARASLSTFGSTLVLFSINGAPPSAPNAIDLATANAVSADPSLSFDFAFDVDTTKGTITVLPVRKLTTQLAGAHQVGLLKVSTPFDSLTKAPHSGYVNDSALVVVPGQTTAIAVNNPVYCYGSLISGTYYGKMVVDSIDVHRALHVRVVVDPNCGFYTLTPGVVPKD